MNISADGFYVLKTKCRENTMRIKYIINHKSFFVPPKCILIAAICKIG
jgi:hypothetical protein